MKPERHRNIPIFIPHFGCGNECIFCDQRQITGNKSTVDEAFIIGEIESRLSGIKDGGGDVQIAFFGGSFTGIDRKTMILCLETAQKYIRNGVVSSIRISTRPDYISEEILDILACYGVKSIELGIQSLDDEVLRASKRGHKAEGSIAACRLIKSGKYKFSLTGQMMTGMYKSTREKDYETAEKMISLGIDSARIYPTIAIKGTELYSCYLSGRYTPMTVEEAVAAAVPIVRLLRGADMKILRVGLCSGDILNDPANSVGPYHPAFGELVESKIVLEDIIEQIDGAVSKGSDVKSVEIISPNRFISQVIGQKGINRRTLREKYNKITINFTVCGNNSDCGDGKTYFCRIN